MDLLAALPLRLPLIIPSTVIRETRHRSLPLFNRLQQILQDEDRCVWVWWNEERRDTATIVEDGEGGESSNDRNDRGMSAPLGLEHDHLLIQSHSTDLFILFITPQVIRAKPTRHDPPHG